MAYIKGVEQYRYGVLVSELKNDYAKGQDDYPTDLATAFALVNLYEMPKNDQLQQNNNNCCVNNQRHDVNIHNTTSDGQYMFAQNPANKLHVDGKDGRFFERMLCYSCQTYGHYAGNCNEPNIRGTTLVYEGFVMTQMVCKKHSYINKEWILLDTQSTESVFNNKKFFTNIQESKKPCVP